MPWARPLMVPGRPLAQSAFKAMPGVYGGFPTLRGTFFGGPYNRDYNLLGSLLGSPILGNYQKGVQ